MFQDFSKVPSPCYVLDADVLRENLRLISRVRQESGAEIILAFKAFAMWSAFPIIREYNFKSTASSLSEARLAFEELGSRAHTFSPAYTENEFAKIMECSSHITFNSLTQYEHFAQHIALADHPISLGLRINPEFSVVETDHCLCESSADDLEALMKQVSEKFEPWIKQVKWVNFGGAI